MCVNVVNTPHSREKVSSEGLLCYVACTADTIYCVRASYRGRGGGGGGGGGGGAGILPLPQPKSGPKSQNSHFCTRTHVIYRTARVAVQMLCGFSTTYV